MFDNNLFLRTTGAASLTQTETATGIAISGTPLKGLSLVVGVPKLSIGDTMQVSLQHSTDDSTYTTLLNMETVASVTAADSTSKIYIRRFATELKYVRSVITVAGTSPDFGAVWAAVGDSDQWNTLALGMPTSTPNPTLP